jgi:hypothetical protein
MIDVNIIHKDIKERELQASLWRDQSLSRSLGSDGQWVELIQLVKKELWG